MKAHGVLTEVDLFDAQFFEITQAEAELIDPQQRLFLHYCLQAIESAGYNQDTYSGLISVYAGVSVNTYLYNDIYPNIEPPDTLKQFHLMVANDKDFLATRVSYKLNFKGPSYTVQTACSTSLVAIHQACQGLLSGECDLALAGGVTVKLPQITGYLYEEGQIFSADGHVYAFDSRANGTVLGNGIGIVVLKLLKDALADGDTIHAVIKSSATNNDGSFKASYSAPSKDGQALVIAEAQALAGVNGDDISYVEAHGTGTLLGDPVEIAALTQAFRKTTDKKQFCGIGSVKTNLGHLDAASGVAGLIKTVLMLKNRQLVPSLNYQRPNPGIDFVNSPFYVVDKLGPWESPHGSRRAAVSSFGIGGTNAHVIVEEAPAIEPSGVSRNIQLLTLSAKTAPAMEQATENMAGFLHRHSDINLADLAFTLNIGRREYQHRRLFVLESGKLPNRLDADDCDLCFSNVLDYQPKTLVFEFLGTTVTSSRSTELYQQETIFRESVDDCWQLLEASGHQSGHALLEGFIFEFALAELWEDWGLNPQAMLTQGVGEITAACFAGVLSLDDALSLLAYMSFAPDLQAFTEKLKGIELKAPKIPYTSAVTGTWISEAQATCPCYWAEQLAPALRQGQSHALETQTEVTAYVLPLGEEKNGSSKAVLSRLGQLWLAGFTIDWSRFYAEEKRHRIPLPTYPLAKERCWIASKPRKSTISETLPREPMDDETYGVLLSQPVWQETSRVANMPETTPYQHWRVILCEMPGDAYQASIEAGLPGVSCINLQSPETNIEESFAFYVAEIFTAVQSMLRTPLPTEQANAARGIMLQIVAPSGSGRMFSGLVGLLKTARLENPKFIAQLIERNRLAPL